MTEESKADLLDELAKRLREHKQPVAQRSCLSNSALFSRWIIDESGHTCKGRGTPLRTFNTESPEPLVHEVIRGLQHGEHGGEERGDSPRLLRVLREFFFVPSVFKSLSSITERERLNKIT